jgi:hypothetical protein
MVAYGAGLRTTFTGYSFICLTLMTPPLVLLLASIYVATGWRGRQEFALWSLLLCWVGLPILRIAMPRSNFYDGNRHFIEYVPALACLAGMGAARGGSWLWKRWTTNPRTAGLGARVHLVGGLAAGVLGAACLVWPVAQYHPYETTYFNFFVGGLGGAQQRGLFNHLPPTDIRANGTEGDYWFSSAREGARDLRALMKSPDDHLSMCGPGREHAKANWAVDPMPHLFESNEPEFADVKLMYVSPRESLCWWRQVRRLESERPIIKRVERGGGLIYEILGFKDGKKRIPTSPETDYERHPDPRDKYTWWKYEP